MVHRTVVVGRLGSNVAVAIVREQLCAITVVDWGLRVEG